MLSSLTKLDLSTSETKRLKSFARISNLNLQHENL